jgi:hypothetical protein
MINVQGSEKRCLRLPYRRWCNGCSGVGELFFVAVVVVVVVVVERSEG